MHLTKLACEKRWVHQDSNLGPTGYEPVALPLSYGPSNKGAGDGIRTRDQRLGRPMRYQLRHSRRVVGAGGLEPPASRSQTARSNLTELRPDGSTSIAQIAGRGKHNAFDRSVRLRYNTINAVTIFL